MVSIIEPSPHDPATAYMAAARHKHGDYAPYLYVTQDYGATWTKITQGIPDQDFTRVIREDPARRGLLYAGTETGLYVSLNGGERWESLQLNLPVAPVYDLEVKDGDLLAATHGRSFWVLDDLTPLRELGDDAIDGPAHLLKPRNTTRLLPQSGFRGPASRASTTCPICSGCRPRRGTRNRPRASGTGSGSTPGPILPTAPSSSTT